jgi:isoquinoline 1-oxidoreductase alpha subunit
MIELLVNGRTEHADVDPRMPLFWVLRDAAGLTGTKFGCGVGACGACTVHVDGVAVRSCQLPAEDAAGRAIVTIEAPPSREVRALIDAWIALDVAQCGYCQPGQIMQAAELLRTRP